MTLRAIKQDLNFLEKPLWFQDVRHDGLGFVWNDRDGFVYRSGYKVPDKVDIVILLYLMLKSQRAGYQTEIEVTRREVLKECGLPTRDNKYYRRVEDSLKRWTNVTLEFKGTFYDNKRYLSIVFHIIDHFSIDEETKRVKICFNPNWLLKIKESQFFKYINFEYYKALKRPVTKRLYEILCKMCYDGKEWSIRLTKLGAKLTLYKRKVQTADGEKEVIYASDVLVAIKPAINEINRLAKTPDICKKTGFPERDIFSLKYRITGDKQNRVIHFKKIPVFPTKSQSRQSDPQEESRQPEQEREPPDLSLLSERDEALVWLKTLPGFSKCRQGDIAALPIVQVAQCYPGIRRAYEEQSKAGKAPKPGWVYNAFKEKWSFPDKSEEQADFSDTPEGRRSRAAKELYERWNEEQQRKFWEDMQRYALGCVSQENLEKMKANGGIWETWGPVLMGELGYLSGEDKNTSGESDRGI